MTTRLEVEHVTVDNGRETKFREALLELEDREGAQETQFGVIQIDVKRVPVYPAYYKYLAFSPWSLSINSFDSLFPYNTDITIDATHAPKLAERLKARKRRISVGTDGNGAQQIGTGETLFVHSDLFRRK